MNFSLSSLAAGFVFGVFGVYILKQGKKDANIPKILIGVAMLAYPYFIENIYLIWGLGAVLLFLGYKI